MALTLPEKPGLAGFVQAGVLVGEGDGEAAAQTAGLRSRGGACVFNLIVTTFPSCI